MKFKAEDGSDWRRMPGAQFNNVAVSRDMLVIERIPEKAELEKWADDFFAWTGASGPAKKGFFKAIEVLDKNLKPYMSYLEAREILRKFAGVEK